jgi:prepilin-type N-terminal cleavage/methylation domain-containing protein
VLPVLKPPAHPARKRAGISLIELMVVISILAALLSFATVLLGLLLRADHAGHDAMARQLAITHLSRQLRADAHAATSANVPQDNPGALELTLDDGRSVSWKSSEGTVSRFDRRGDAVVSREAYVLPEGVTTFSIAAENHIVRLKHSGLPPPVLENSAETMARPSNVLTIDAAIGISVTSSDDAQTDEFATPRGMP